MINVDDILISNLYSNISHREKLAEILSGASKIQIMCPYISEAGAEWLVRTKDSSADLEIITEISSTGLITGVQSPEALEILLDSGCKVHFLTKRLHAKMFWIDESKLLITSANLTSNGLSENFELGFLVEPWLLHGKLNPKSPGLKEYIPALWKFVLGFTEPLSTSMVFDLKELRNSASEVKSRLDYLAHNFENCLPKSSFVKNQRACDNRQNIITDLSIQNMFSGFREKDWDVFDTELDLNDKNLIVFRNELNEFIDPILKRFYTQLRHSPILTNNLSGLQEGLSRQVQLKSRFPHNRYLYLTRPRDGKRSNKHIGEPSFIVGMGKKHGKSWLEIRCGIEEDYLNSLTPSGERLLLNMRSQIDRVIDKLKALKGNWTFSHGSYSNDLQESIDVHELNRDRLRSIIEHYLTDRGPADIQIKREYSMQNATDATLLKSSKITQSVSEDFEKLAYFFELAHR
jgi:hypothetical protein